MTGFLSTLKGWMSLLPRFSFGNCLEIIIITFIVYQVLNWIMQTRAFALLKVIFVILLFTFMAFILKLNTILWIIEKCSTIAVIALVVIFQPELRKALEQLGSTKYFFSSLITPDKHDTMMTKEYASMLSKAVFRMAKVKTGALIVIEQNETLDDYIKTGIEIDGLISTGLIINTFEKNTPLHDGAVIVRGNRIVAATCYLPLSDNVNISKDLGTRHRAALGISEVTDSITIVVSEETGGVSWAYKGKLIKVSEEAALDSLLISRINRAEVRSFKTKLLKKSSEEGNGDEK